MPESRKSKKRDAIYQLLRSTDAHPTAEWVYSQLKPEFPHLSLGTVYRNLHAFRGEGKLRCVATVNGQDRFDANTAPHAHFICTHCGVVEDLHQLPPPPMPEIPARVDAYQLNYYGTCNQCLHKHNDIY